MDGAEAWSQTLDTIAEVYREFEMPIPGPDDIDGFLFGIRCWLDEINRRNVAKTGFSIYFVAPHRYALTNNLGVVKHYWER